MLVDNQALMQEHQKIEDFTRLMQRGAKYHPHYSNPVMLYAVLVSKRYLTKYINIQTTGNLLLSINGREVEIIPTKERSFYFEHQHTYTISQRMLLAFLCECLSWSLDQVQELPHKDTGTFSYPLFENLDWYFEVETENKKMTVRLKDNIVYYEELLNEQSKEDKITY